MKRADSKSVRRGNSYVGSNPTVRAIYAELAERLMVLAWKASYQETGTQVQILHSAPFYVGGRLTVKIADCGSADLSSTLSHPPNYAPVTKW